MLHEGDVKGEAIRRLMGVRGPTGGGCGEAAAAALCCGCGVFGGGGLVGGGGAWVCVWPGSVGWVDVVKGGREGGGGSAGRLSIYPISPSIHGLPRTNASGPSHRRWRRQGGVAAVDLHPSVHRPWIDRCLLRRESWSFACLCSVSPPACLSFDTHTHARARALGSAGSTHGAWVGACVMCVVVG
jgi:hypothetical protein